MLRPMPEILEELAPVLGRSHEEKKLLEDARFCPGCGKATLDTSNEMGFLCQDSACGYSGVRALTFRKNARFQISDGRLYHFSVGAAVFVGSGRR